METLLIILSIPLLILGLLLPAIILISLCVLLDSFFEAVNFTVDSLIKIKKLLLGKLKSYGSRVF